MKKVDIDNCNAVNWLPLFKNHSFRHRIVHLTEEFTNEIMSDGVYLPKSTSEAVDEEEEEEEEEERFFPPFPELEAQITSAISDLRGAAFPKLNWHAPLDAAWIQPENSLCCRSYSDVIMLLQASDDVLKDILAPYVGCEEEKEKNSDVALILKRFEPVKECYEFRVFISDSVVVGACQRHVDAFYKFLANEDEIERIGSVIVPFCESEIIPKFALKRYVVDLYIESGKDRVWIVDFAPWGAPTDPLMFDWEKLEVEVQFQFLVVKNEAEKMYKVSGDPVHLADLQAFHNNTIC